jgi:predicted Na+-dependent transporter
MTEFLNHLEAVSVLVFLVSSMTAMGLTLTPRALAAPLYDVRLVVLALALNFLIAPALAWSLTTVIPLDRGHAAGLMLLGGVAGAPFLPKLIETARGDLGSAAALMALLTAGTILFMPFALPLMISGLTSDPWNIARPLVVLIFAPLAAGMVIRRFAALFAGRAAPVLGRIGNAALLLLFVLMIVLNFPALRDVVGSGAILAALLFFTGLFALAWSLGGSQRKVLGLATTARNFGAALAPAENCFDDPEVTVMIVVGAIVCLVVSFTAAGLLRRRAMI